MVIKQMVSKKSAGYTTLGDAFTSRASLDMPVTSATATTVDSISYHDVLTRECHVRGEEIIRRAGQSSAGGRLALGQAYGEEDWPSGKHTVRQKDIGMGLLWLGRGVLIGGIQGNYLILE